MNKPFNILLVIIMLFLSACSTQPTKKSTTENTEKESNASVESITVNNTTAPDELSRQKGDKTLKLVRVMEGGACKNAKQGVSGMFLLYAHPDDVDRIKKTQGAEVFAKFEKSISEFSMIALQRAVNNSEFSKLVFIKDEAEQQKTTQQLIQNFNNYITTAINEFEKESTLTIVIEPSLDSLNFYLDGCDIPHAHK
ncbi:MAG: hypothetical protein GQ569_08380 [Methylococcaceae bacterium]|nr:hypothetical protein [Methylococcaceae bacterium]